MSRLETAPLVPYRCSLFFIFKLHVYKPGKKWNNKMCDRYHHRSVRAAGAVEQAQYVSWPNGVKGNLNQALFLKLVMVLHMFVVVSVVV